MVTQFFFIYYSLLVTPFKSNIITLLITFWQQYFYLTSSYTSYVTFLSPKSTLDRSQKLLQILTVIDSLSKSVVLISLIVMFSLKLTVSIIYLLPIY